MIPPPSDRSSKTILLVEDNKALRDAFQEILEASSYRAYSAENGREALALYQEQNLKVDLLISDINMPEMNGIELASILRQTDPHTKVVIMSGLAQSETNQQTYATPIDGWLQKPIGMKDFLRTVNELLRHSA